MRPRHLEVLRPSSFALRRTFQGVETSDTEEAESFTKLRALLEPLRHAEARAAKKRALAKKTNVPFDPHPDAEEEDGGRGALRVKDAKNSPFTVRHFGPLSSKGEEGRRSF